MVLRLAGMDPASGAVWATSDPLWVRPTGSWRRRRRPRAPDPRLPGCRLGARLSQTLRAASKRGPRERPSTSARYFVRSA